MQWHGVPASLAARLNKYGAAGTRLVTLGKDDSFVVIGADGSGLRNLGPKNFEALDKHLGSLPNLSSIHVSLSVLFSLFAATLRMRPWGCKSSSTFARTCFAK